MCVRIRVESLQELNNNHARNIKPINNKWTWENENKNYYSTLVKEEIVEKISNCEKVENNNLAPEVKLNLIDNLIIKVSFNQSLNNAKKFYREVDDLSDLTDILMVLEKINKNNFSIKLFIAQVLHDRGNYETAKLKLQEAFNVKVGGEFLREKEFLIELQEINAKTNSVDVEYLEWVNNMDNLEQNLQKKVNRLLGDYYFLQNKIQKSNECYSRSSIDIFKICRNMYINSTTALHPKKTFNIGIQNGYLNACKDPKMLAFALVLYKILFPKDPIPDVFESDHRLFFLAPTIIEFMEKLKKAVKSEDKYSAFSDFSKKIESDYQTYCVDRFSKTQSTRLTLKACKEKLGTTFNIILV